MQIKQMIDISTHPITLTMYRYKIFATTGEMLARYHCPPIDCFQVSISGVVNQLINIYQLLPYRKNLSETAEGNLHFQFSRERLDGLQ